MTNQLSRKLACNYPLIQCHLWFVVYGVEFADCVSRIRSIMDEPDGALRVLEGEMKAPRRHVELPLPVMWQCGLVRD
jgi:hypothetical protein